MKDTPIKVAAILACHNRKTLTLACLDALYSQELTQLADIQTYLLDDGSTDGTAEAVQSRFNNVNVIKADGSLFWNEGMRTAFQAALDAGADYYLWLNDDTTLYENALELLIKTHHTLSSNGTSDAIIIGSVQDPNTKKLTYGGMIKNSNWHPFHFQLIPPTDTPQQCYVMHGNCVLIPDEVAKKVGNMDSGYSHAIGDIDYAFKARKHGASIWSAPGYAGTCSTNPTEGSWLDTSLSLKQRWKHMKSPKGLPPSDWLLFSRKHAGFFWPVFGFLPYVKLFISALFAKNKTQKLRSTT